MIYKLDDLFTALPEATQLQLREKYAAPEPRAHFYKLIFALFEDIVALRMNGIINIHETYLAQLTKYRAILLLMGDFLLR